MVGTVATQASKQMAHSISFGINLAVTTNVFQLVWHQNRNATKGGGNGSGGGSNKTTSKRPVFLVFCSIPLIMLDNVRHVLQDGEMIGKWSSMYRSDKKCYHHDFRCLSLVGLDVSNCHDGWLRFAFTRRVDEQRRVGEVETKV